MLQDDVADDFNMIGVRRVTPHTGYGSPQAFEWTPSLAFNARRIAFKEHANLQTDGSTAVRLSLTLDLTHSCNIPPGRGSRHYVPPAHLRQVSEQNTSFGYASALRTAVGLSLKSILTCGSRIMSHWLNCTSTCSVAMYVL